MNGRPTRHGKIAIARNTHVTKNIGVSGELIGERIGRVNSAAERESGPTQQIAHLRESGKQVCFGVQPAETKWRGDSEQK